MALFFITLVGGILFLGVLILILPFTYSVRFALGDDVAYRVFVGSILLALTAERADEGVTSVRLRLLSLPFISVGRKGKNKKKESDNADRKDKRSGFPWYLLNRETLKHISGLFVDLVSMLKPKIFQVNARVGFVEPDYNGFVLAFISTAKALYPGFPLRWDVVWEQEQAEADGEIAGRVILATMFWRVVVFIFSWQTMQLLLQWRRQKKSAVSAT